MAFDLIEIVAKELQIRVAQVSAVSQLLADGGTIPFIARYRKEATGSLDEVQIAAIRDRLQQLEELEKRRAAILKSLEEQGKLNPELKKAVEQATGMSELEDIYLPYRPKRRTKATIAKEKGLEPLAALIYEQGRHDPEFEAKAYIDEEKQVTSVEEALSGAADIIAEWISEHSEVRAKTRTLFMKHGVFKSKVIKGKETEGIKFKDYFDWSEPASKAPSHRVLAMRRGEKEMILSLDVVPDDEEVLPVLERMILKNQGACAEWVKRALHDGYKRLLKPSMETELRLETKKKADEEAIRVFADNLRQLLLASPLGEKSVLAVDPGFRTGCKVAALDRQGKLLEYTAIFPHEPQRKTQEAETIIRTMLKKYALEAVAIGNGTAGRETEQWLRSLKLESEPAIIMVNESGASIYSASEAAREEFPELDLTVRGAISIGRRLKDPLAELVKIDPKSIGVGQYQHDVDQTMLKSSLDEVVLSCVNGVGVELNTASRHLLSYVSGLGPQLAGNIVAYREEHGPFQSRQDLLKVSRLGGKAFEQCAGFLRIRGAANPLDSSAVHPESYPVVQKMASDLGCSVFDLMNSEELRSKLDLKKYVTDQIGMPTLKDIMAEIAKPGRDPRQQFEVVSFADGVNSPEDLRQGMKLTGIVTNVTNFGAFVDIGVHQDGLVHISHLADRFIKHPSEAVSVAQKVEVTVVEVDLPRKRISLSMKKDPFATAIPSTKKEKSPEASKPIEGDLQAQLARLKGKFG